MLLVVIGHASYIVIKSKYGGIDYEAIIIDGGMTINSLHKTPTIITSVVYCFHRPLFIFVSGILFAKTFKKYSSFSYLLK